MASADTSGPVLDPDDAVRVFIRVRPLNTREKTNNESFAWSYNKTSLLEETQNGQRVYAYDRYTSFLRVPSSRYSLVLTLFFAHPTSQVLRPRGYQHHSVQRGRQTYGTEMYAGVQRYRLYLRSDRIG